MWSYAGNSLQAHINHKHNMVNKEYLFRMPISSSLNEKFKIALNNVGLFPLEEYSIGFYTVDFCFSDKKVVVEVDGDYWHSNPAIYPVPKNSQQRKSIGKDKAEKTFLTNRGWTLLRFWKKKYK